MRLLIATDSFKECASSLEAGRAMADGWARVFPDWTADIVPVADGGEGMTEALVTACGGAYAEAVVTGPLGEPVRARYGLLDGGATAVIEMAAASGLPLVPPSQRDPRLTTTRGTGELMLDAARRGVTKILLGIGGSATNDGGAGMAQALGWHLLDATGAPLPHGGAALARLDRIEGDLAPELLNVAIIAACDVDNPLCGPRGASHVYGPQKGATPEIALALDAALEHFGEIIEAQLHVSVRDVPGAGAAGGLGAGLLAFANASLRRGIEVILDAARFDERARDATLVLTGEGRIDAQTAHGKTVAGVAHAARRAHKPVIALAGTLGEGWRETLECGVNAIHCVAPGPMTLEAALRDGKTIIADAAERLAHTWKTAANQ
jgi:glycerate 2-kinase